MTPAYIAPKRALRSYKFSWIRVIVISLMLFLTVTACLYLYHTAFREYGVYLTEQDKKSTAWITEQFSYMLPFIAIAVFQYAVYAKHDNHDGILQKERAYEILLVTLLVYAVLLPYIWHKSDALLKVALVADLDVNKNEGKEYQTLLLSVIEWFIRLAIPLCLLFLYHQVRAKAEIQEMQSSVEATPPEEAADQPHAEASPQDPSPEEGTADSAPYGPSEEEA